MKSGIKVYFFMFIFMFYFITYKLNSNIYSKDLLIIFTLIRVSITFILIAIIILNSVFKILITLKKYDLSLASNSTIYNIFSEENSAIIIKSLFYSVPFIIIGIYMNMYIHIPIFEKEFSSINNSKISYSLSNIFSMSIIKFNSLILLFPICFIYFIILIIYIANIFLNSIAKLVNNKNFFETRIKKISKLIRLINFRLQKFINFIYKLFFISISTKFINQIKRKFYLLLKHYKRGTTPPDKINNLYI